jgi:Fic-DOC domain mobile mystery protein B
VTDELFEQPSHATPLRAEEADALRAAVVDRQQLNEIEATNVAAGRSWALRSRKDHLNEDFLNELHKRMFGKVWKWAGDYRTFDVNIGTTPHYEVAVRVRECFGDARYWVEHKTYQPHELAIRLHHRLVLIHPFVNGNGRCTRLMADIAVQRLGVKELTWGASSLVNAGEARAAYVAALQRADNHEIGPLVAFAIA